MHDNYLFPNKQFMKESILSGKKNIYSERDEVIA